MAARGDGCSGFGNLFTEIAENSAHGSLVARLPPPGDAGGAGGGAGLQLCLVGTDASWFYLDGRSVRLNVSAGRALDREELESPVLMVALTCAEDGSSPVEFRIIVQVLNENDNRPHFQGATVLTHNVSELAPVHSVVFSAQAEDADGDTLMYVIDTASPDARFFRIDLPNSGRVVLARPLDFESRRHLEVVVTAVEMNTRERFNASARVRVNVLDGDDQYPQFLPCAPRAPHSPPVCTSPVYTANVTEGQLQGGPLSFSPGAVYAEDGDRGLRAAITYSLLAGQESSRFHIDNVTGAITLLRAVESSRQTPEICLSVMASQVNDPSKYAVARALVRVLAPNRHPPRFPRARYRAFVPAAPRRAALLLTFGGQVLALRAHDPDFPEVSGAGRAEEQGLNPQVRYTLSHGANQSQQLFQVMPNGLLVAQADQLRPGQSFHLQVLARDEESGETSNTTVELEVLWPGQAAPRDPSEPPAVRGVPLGAVAGGAGALLLLGAVLLLALLALRARRRRRRQQRTADRAALAIEKHPNVSLRWFQPVQAGKSPPSPPRLYYPNEGYSEVSEESLEEGPGSDPRVPPPLLQLLEDSIEC
ncbi:cadherin-related family member 5-like [Acridotheres tristis]